MRLLLAASLALASPLAAAPSDREKLDNLRQNMHRAFLRGYLRRHQGKTRPAPPAIRSLGARIAKSADIGLRFRWHFYVVDTPDANALATPIGNVFIHQGLLDLGLGEDELAALLAHEVAHLALDHPIARLGRRVGAARLAGYNARVLGRSSAQLQYLNDQLENLESDREEESAADRLGMELLVKASIPPEAMAELLRKLHKHEVAAGKRRIPYLSSHPPMPERIRRVEAEAASMPLLPDKPRLK